jgi:hypothetical protein
MDVLVGLKLLIGLAAQRIVVVHASTGTCSRCRRAGMWSSSIGLDIRTALPVEQVIRELDVVDDLTSSACSSSTAASYPRWPRSPMRYTRRICHR